MQVLQQWVLPSGMGLAVSGGSSSEKGLNQETRPPPICILRCQAEVRDGSLLLTPNSSAGERWWGKLLGAAIKSVWGGAGPWVPSVLLQGLARPGLFLGGAGF